MSEYNNIYIKRFFILLSSTGEIVCERQYKHASDGDNHGENDHAMDNAILASFASSANNFMKYVMESSISNNLMSKQKGGNSNASNKNSANNNNNNNNNNNEIGNDNDINEFSFNNDIYSFLRIGDHILVAQSGKGVGRYIASQRLYGMRGMLLLLFGDPKNWTEDRFELDGLENIIDHFLASSNLSFLLNGTRHVPLKRKATDQVKRLIASFENNPIVHYTLITLGQSVLCSTLPANYTRLIAEMLIVRPLGAIVSTTTPIYVNGTWMQLVITRFRAFHVAVVTNIDSRRELTSALKTFEEKFHDATKLLPTEEPPILLRHYANYNTAAFALVKESTGVAVVPELRDGPGDEKKRINRIFQWFFCRVKDMKEGGFMNVTISNNIYVFHAMRYHGCDIYALFSDKVESNDMIRMCKEIVEAAQTKHMLLQTANTK